MSLHNSTYLESCELARVRSQETCYVGRQADINRPIAAGSIPGPVSGLKLASTGNGTWNYAFTGSAAPNGTLYNSALAETPLSSGMMYTKIFVRHWDACKRLSRVFKNLLTYIRCHAEQE